MIPRKAQVLRLRDSDSGGRTVSRIGRLACALALCTVLGLLLARPAAAASAGWDVTWIESPTASGPREPSQHMAADGGRVAYLTGYRGVVLCDASTGVANVLTSPGTVAGTPVIEGDYVAWSAFSADAGEEGLVLHTLSDGSSRKVADGHIYGDPILCGGRILWMGGTNESVVLSLYDIASGTNTALNAGAWGWSEPLLLNTAWVVWHEHQANGSDLLFSYDIGAAEKRACPEAAEGRMYAVVGDRLVVSRPAIAGQATKLALFNLRTRVFTDIPASAGAAISSLAVDEAGGRLAWTATDEAGAFLAVYAVATGSLERVAMPHHLLGPVEIAGDMVLFRGQAQYDLLSSAPMTLFAYSIANHTLTELGQLLRGFPFATDGVRAYWIDTVLANDGWPRLSPHWFWEWSTSIAASEHLFVATAPLVTIEPFADIAGTHPYRTAIVSLFDKGAVAGYESGGHTVFRPDEPYLRAQFAKVLVEALDLPVEEGLVAPFWDLGPDDPASLYPHEYIAAAYQAGLIEGFPDGSFHPWQPAGRAQLVTLTVRAADRLRPGLLLDTPFSPTYYTPLPRNFDPTHARNLEVAEDNGLLDGLLGYGWEWDPWQAATRAEGGQVLWNLLRMDLRH